ncbi:unnamed protein product [Choristocarpus tenellus]
MPTTRQQEQGRILHTGCVTLVATILFSLIVGSNTFKPECCACGRTKFLVSHRRRILMHLNNAEDDNSNDTSFEEVKNKSRRSRQADSGWWSPQVKVTNRLESGQGHKRDRQAKEESADETNKETVWKNSGFGEDRATIATKLLESRGANDMESAQQAYEMFVEELTSRSSSMDDSVLQQSAAEALLSWLRTSTVGNGLGITQGGDVETSDTNQRREEWRKNAPKIISLIKDTGLDTTQDAQLQRIFAEAVMYQSSSKGVLKAALTGDAITFKSAVNVLVDKYPEHDNGVGFIFLGAFYLAAPWPIQNPPKAKILFDKAVEVNGRSRRNIYYAGLARLSLGQWKEAAAAFRRALSDDEEDGSCCASPGERDISSFLTLQAGRGLEVALKRSEA